MHYPWMTPAEKANETRRERNTKLSPEAYRLIGESADRYRQLAVSHPVPSVRKCAATIMRRYDMGL